MPFPQAALCRWFVVQAPEPFCVWRYGMSSEALAIGPLPSYWFHGRSEFWRSIGQCLFRRSSIQWLADRLYKSSRYLHAWMQTSLYCAVPRCTLKPLKYIRFKGNIEGHRHMQAGNTFGILGEGLFDCNRHCIERNAVSDADRIEISSNASAQGCRE